MLLPFPHLDALTPWQLSRWNQWKTALLKQNDKGKEGPPKINLWKYRGIPMVYYSQELKIDSWNEESNPLNSLPSKTQPIHQKQQKVPISTFVLILHTSLQTRPSLKLMTLLVTRTMSRTRLPSKNDISQIWYHKCIYYLQFVS